MLSATGGSERHALVLDHGLRPLFAFFSADIIADRRLRDRDRFRRLPAASAALLAAHRPRRATNSSWRLDAPAPSTLADPARIA